MTNGSTPQWGGNVSAMDWTAPNIPTGLAMQPTAPTCKLMGYAFSYDNLSRLTQADYYENNDRSNHYDTRYSYDMMGNIVVLERNGLHDDGEFGLIDYLTFDYEGNQVTKVTDEVSDGPYRKDAWHYRDGSNRETEREYDENGNLVKDSDAKISSIEYNCLNLPRMIKFSNGGKHIYTYDASGRKLRAEHHIPIVVAAEPQIPIEDMIPPNDNPEIPDDSEQMPYDPPQEMPHDHISHEWEMPWQQFEEQVAPFICIMPPMLPDDEIIIEQPMPDDQLMENEFPCDVTATDYCGNFIYENGKLKRILIPGGYVTFANDNINLPEYHFYLTDHQGNIRVVANADGTIEQVNHYYPYGGLMGESTGSDAQPYKYNGKELDRHSGLDWYDYGARWYNGISWMNPDPHAEKYYETSPYSYCHNNPINRIDSDGRDSYLIIWSTQPKTYGHAAFAIDNYTWDANQKKYIANGSMTVYGLFPKEAYSPNQAVHDRSVQPQFVIDNNVTMEKLKTNNFNSGEDYKPDGILKISTNYEIDMKTKETLQGEMNSNKGYRGMSRNCSTFAREGIKSATGTNIKGEESFLWNKYVTPNKLFKETKELGNTTIIVDPEEKIDYEFSKNIGNIFKSLFLKE